MKGICLCCIQNYGLKRFLASSGQKITCAECLAHDVLGVPEEKISELLREYFNYHSHKVGYYMAGNKYLAIDYIDQFSNDLNVSADLETDLKRFHHLFHISIIHGSPRLFIYGVFNKMDVHNETFSDEICDEIFEKSESNFITQGFELRFPESGAI